MLPDMIDSHAHVFDRSLPLTATRRYAPDYDAPLARYLALLDRHAIGHAVLVQPSFLGTDNRYLLEALRLAGPRCRGVAVVSPDIDAAALQALQACGIRGIRLNLFGLDHLDLRAASWQALFDKLLALNLHVELHAPLVQLPQRLAAILPRRLPIVVDHFGRPGPDDLASPDAFRDLFALAEREQLFIKVSAPYRLLNEQQQDRLPELLARFVEVFSSSRLMWGSDWPHTQHERQTTFDANLAWPLQALSNERDRHNIMYDTAARFYQIHGDHS